MFHFWFSSSISISQSSAYKCMHVCTMYVQVHHICRDTQDSLLCIINYKECLQVEYFDLKKFWILASQCESLGKGLGTSFLLQSSSDCLSKEHTEFLRQHLLQKVFGSTCKLDLSLTTQTEVCKRRKSWCTEIISVQFLQWSTKSTTYERLFGQVVGILRQKLGSVPHYFVI